MNRTTAREVCRREYAEAIAGAFLEVAAIAAVLIACAGIGFVWGWALGSGA